MRWLLVREDGIPDWSLLVAVILALMTLLGGCCSHAHAATVQRVHIPAPAEDDMVRRMCVNCGASWNEARGCVHAHSH